MTRYVGALCAFRHSICTSPDFLSVRSIMIYYADAICHCGPSNSRTFPTRREASLVIAPVAP